MREASRRRTPKRGRRAASIWIAVAMLLAASLHPPTARAAGPDQLAATYLSGVNGGVPDDYAVVYERTTQGGAWAGKLEDLRTGQISIVYRTASGRTGGADLLTAQQSSTIAGLSAVERKGDQPLRAAVAGAPPADLLPVALWVDADTEPAEQAVADRHPEVDWIAGRPMSNDLAVMRALRGELWEARRQVYEQATAALRQAVARAGGTVAYTSTSAPLVFADLPAGQVSALAGRTDVVSLGLEGAWSPQLSTAGGAVEANWTSGSADRGTGVRVAVVEYHNVRATGDLAGKVVSAHSTSGTLAYTASGQFDHPTWVAGAVAGQSSSYGGVAPGALIVSSGTGGYTPSLAYDRRIVAAADWAVSPAGGDADIVNSSLVQDTAQGAEEARRYFDSLVDVDGRLAISAAGNYVNFGAWQVGSPGTGWNVLTVGGVDDRGTSGHADDRIWYVPGSNGSNWLDPPSEPWNVAGDFNKPNLVAPAVGVRTANGLAASGTSVATPIVAGIAAQVIANQPVLGSWPEGLRAILTAAAVNRVPMPDGTYNLDHEGAGMASAPWANRIATAGDGPFGGYRIGAVVAGQALSQQVNVHAGDRLRVALAWDSHTSGSGDLNLTDTLRTDLDLRVRLPGAGTIGSYTFDNAYEFVEVTVPSAGTATIEVVQSRFGASSERYGLAWAKVGDVTPPTVSVRAPRPGEPWAVPSTSVSARFSEPASNVTGQTFVLRRASTGKRVAATVRYSSSSRIARLTPKTPLAPGSYVARLGTSIVDATGNALRAKHWEFTVVGHTALPSQSWGFPRRIRLRSGGHTGYRFDANGAVTAHRHVSLGSATIERVDRRAQMPGSPGMWLHVVSGSLADYWVRESGAAGLRGGVGQISFASHGAVQFAATTHTGYHYASSGRVTGSKSLRLTSASMAHADARRVINGRWQFHIVDGIWAGYWVPESADAYLAGAQLVADLGRGAGPRLTVRAGQRSGYRYSASGTVIGHRTARTTSQTTSTAVAWAIINGQPAFYTTTGRWAGYWIPESGAVHLP